MLGSLPFVEILTFRPPPGERVLNLCHPEHIWKFTQRMREWHFWHLATTILTTKSLKIEICTVFFQNIYFLCLKQCKFCQNLWYYTHISSLLEILPKVDKYLHKHLLMVSWLPNQILIFGILCRSTFDTQMTKKYSTAMY